MIEERTAQLQQCMYQYSRAIYRSIKDMIEPYADRHVVLNCFGGGGAYWGPVAHHLGRLAATLGHGAEARARLERAIEACETMGAAAFAPRSRDALAALAGG